ncbi:hypothetical protein [Paenirhodobacter sp.]|jgi:hypothetical protein|uniref:hypothetical protein n=1 Tax=Paenirhodobacter sp. TaxID=1965326 RepID=UPI003B50DF7D
MRAVLLALPFLALPAQAARTEYDDRMAQIAVIAQSALVADAVSRTPVEALVRGRIHPDGRTDWELRTERCTVSVQLAPVRRSSIGPLSWVLRSVSPCRMR